jgi:VWFA-related protein
MPRTAPLRSIALVAGLTVAHVAHAAQPPSSPTFSVSTELIQIDVAVTDSSGKPVSSLVAEDFEIEQDGKWLPVRFAEYVEPSAQSAQAAQGVTASPERFTGRRILVVVDDSFMNFDSVVRSKEALAGVVAESLRAGDLLSIVGTNDPAVQPLVFTAEPAELARQIDRIRWDAIKRQQLNDRDFLQAACPEPRLGNDLQASSFTFGPYAVVASVLRQLRALPGRKALLLLADGIQTCHEYRDATWERIRRLADAANRSAVVIYGVQTTPFVTGVKMPEHRATEADVRGSRIQPLAFANTVSEFMRVLSVRTGGFARRRNDIRELVDRALADFGGYYLLAYEPPPNTFQSGKPKFRKVSVRVRKDKLKVRARAGFYSVDDEQLFAR